MTAAALRDSLDVRPVLAAWEAAVAAPAWAGPPVWMRGDLHSANLLVSNGALTGVIDFGLPGVRDPACDLMVAWTYLSAGAREVFRDALELDDPTWARGRDWALDLGLMAAAYSADNPVLGNIGRYTIAEGLADSGQATQPRAGHMSARCPRLIARSDAAGAHAAPEATSANWRLPFLTWLGVLVRALASEGGSACVPDHDRTVRAGIRWRALDQVR